MMAYLVMMAIRLIELRRVLKESGSIYLHCDPTASHYLKLVMDSVFGFKNYLNEIVWCYKEREIAKKYWNKKHDVILFYCKNYKNKNRVFNWELAALKYSPETLKKYNLTDEKGRKYQIRGKGGSYIGKQQLDPSIEKKHPEWTYRDYLDEKKGIPPRDWISPSMETLICPNCKEEYVENYKFAWLNRASAERLGYPTQKPEALIELFIKVSSNEGDIILDPFCGCGTTIIAAEKLKRKWIGIDVTHLAISLMRHRLIDTFGESIEFNVIGEPIDLKGAEELARQDPFQFEWWAVGKIGGRPAQDEKKKGKDKGIDGYIYFHDEPVGKGKTKKIIIQVKSGHINPSQIRDLKGTLEREKAQIGVFITLRPPTKGMKKEALEAGYYISNWWGKKYPKIQILTIQEILEGKAIDYPPRTNQTFPKAKKYISDKAEQYKLIKE